jgi:hypothetical protein
MRTVQGYREHAAECRRLAARARTPEGRDAILKMAETWDELADGREKLLRKRAHTEALG